METNTTCKWGDGSVIGYSASHSIVFSASTVLVLVCGDVNHIYRDGTPPKLHGQVGILSPFQA